MMRQKKSGQLTTGRGLTLSDPGHDNAGPLWTSRVVAYIIGNDVLISMWNTRSLD